MSGPPHDPTSRARWGDATLPAAPSSPLVPDERSYLIVIEGDSSRTFHLPPSGEVLIGRGEAAALRVDDPSVSRTHAKLATTPSEADLTDLGAQNGTYINGERLE